jgi:hypothetical protein
LYDLPKVSVIVQKLKGNGLRKEFSIKEPELKGDL